MSFLYMALPLLQGDQVLQGLPLLLQRSKVKCAYVCSERLTKLTKILPSLPSMAIPLHSTATICLYVTPSPIVPLPFALLQVCWVTFRGLYSLTSSWSCSFYSFLNVTPSILISLLLTLSFPPLFFQVKCFPGNDLKDVFLLFKMSLCPPLLYMM